MSNNLEQLMYDLDSDVEDIRREACCILALEGTTDAIPKLQTLCAEDTVAVRYFARKAINGITRRCGVSEPEAVVDPASFTRTGKDGQKREFDATAYRRSLETNAPSFRTAVLNKTLELSMEAGAAAILPALESHVASDIPPREKSITVKAIGLIGGAAQIPVLVPLLSDKNYRLRADTIEALEYIGDQQIYPLIVPSLQDPDNRVKANAAVALKNFGEQQSLDLLEEMLSDGQVWMRDSAAYALREIKSQRSIKLLLKVLKSEPRYTIYAKAVVSLAKIGERSLIPRIKAFLAVEDDRRKKQMLNLLIRGLQGHEIPLAQKLEAIYPEIGRPETAGGPPKPARLAAVGPPAVRGARQRDDAAVPDGPDTHTTISTLIDDLANPDEEVRKQASIRLSAISDPRAVKALERASRDPDNVVRYYAKKALCAQGVVPPGQSTAGTPGLLPRRFTLPGRRLMLFMALSAGTLLIAWHAFSWLAPEEQVLKTKKIVSSSFERIITSFRPAAGRGEEVTWKGIIRDVNPARGTVVVYSHGYTFTAVLPPHSLTKLHRGDIIEITGTVRSRTTFGTVILKGRTLNVVKGQGTRES